MSKKLFGSLAIRSAVAVTSVSTLLALGACSTGADTAAAKSKETTKSSSSSDSSADKSTGSVGNTVDRAAKGTLKEHGGARRLEADQSEALKEAISASGAKNVILLIGDGMGDSEITAARNVAEGAGGSFKGLDALPVTGQYTHYSLHKDGTPDYVTDSAASGTAWSTGTKTYDGAISVDIDGNPHSTILEIAKANGKATGNVSTAEIQDATPAVQAAHVAKRKCYGPDDAEKCGDDLLEKGGRGSISEQILDTRADVTLGGGLKSFNQTAKAGEWKDKTLLDQAKERGYQVVKNKEELDAISKADQDAPVLGLFSDGNMPVRWKGEQATKEGYLKPAQECAENDERTADIPRLADMTQKAIDLLKDKEEGFFLQVEGASIDKQDHMANPCGQIGETADLDEAVQKALEFAKQDGQTLVVVTADHAHTSQIVDGMSQEDIEEIAQAKNISVEEARATVYPGLSSVLKTKDGGEMTIGYATSENVDVENEGHTGTQLRIAAFGPNAANVAGLTDQTDLFFTIVEALGLDESKTALKK
ncbi:alkaline phosphatase [Corynebacterium sp. sy017]|uniref:alkaline phosphatase n=1 Tax=unclassified Corynebacterium TaxID=2624378 RepID=UPI001184A19D|nr:MULTISPECIES: alkaline phosphatase [unclassified Corynebacterium]MBP3088617.1 alkaline phosphatase [Corynebacterium sp. sy017]QDZ42024.1 alkaline phosphatase [Corynebacterium sp. sy039]TSD91909.1 alkaline phosphatase [Corynebacterium sp. SY003]